MLHSDLSAGLALASGASQAFVAGVFLRFMRARPSWGLGWLAAAFAMAAVLNIGAALTLSFLPEAPNQVIWQLANLVIGVTCMGTLVAGVRLYVGETHPRPWFAVTGTAALYLLLISVRRIHPDWNLAIGGAMLAAALYIYLAVLCRRAAQREPGVGHGIAAAMMTIYAPMVLGGFLIGMDPAELRYWGAVPYSLAGLGLMSACMGRFQAELRELNESLELRVQSRTQELQELVQGLESFNRMVSHDLKGPLGGVHGISGLTLQALERGDTDKAKRFVQAIHSESESLTGLINDLLALARASQAHIEKQTLPVQTIVDDALKAIEISHGHGYTRVVRCMGLNATVEADPGLLRQVMINLIGNALKYSSRVDQPEVRIVVQPQDFGTELIVSDNGVGFDPARKDELFKPFTRLHTQADFEGVGVGLTIVQRIVAGHGGKVWAESQPGRGASFHVWLPAA